MLKEPLSGNCQTVMIAHVSPADKSRDESRNTLVYADRAKNISNKVCIFQSTFVSTFFLCYRFLNYVKMVPKMSIIVLPVIGSIFLISLLFHLEVDNLWSKGESFWGNYVNRTKVPWVKENLKACRNALKTLFSRYIFV